jgi:hypothetical protein
VHVSIRGTQKVSMLNHFYVLASAIRQVVLHVSVCILRLAETTNHLARFRAGTKSFFLSAASRLALGLARFFCNEYRGLLVGKAAGT